MIECMYAKEDSEKQKQTKRDELYCYPTGFEDFIYDKSKVQ